MKRAIAILFLCTLGGAAATRLIVTVVEQKSGRPITDIKAGEFAVSEDKTQRRVEGAEFSTGQIDVMLLLDTSLAGEMVQPVASSLVAQLQEKEQMAVVSFHSSADLIQDFTSSRELLSRAIHSVKYGNEPHVLDALYAAIDGGFEHATFRRVIVLLTAGLEGSSRVSEREAIRLARKNGVSIYPVYVAGSGRWLFESLARQTGGAYFNLRDMERSGGGGSARSSPGARIFEVLRAHYTLTLSGNLSLSEKLKVEVKRPEKLSVSALPVE